MAHWMKTTGLYWLSNHTVTITYFRDEAKGQQDKEITIARILFK